MQTPTLISWSLRVEQELSPNTSLTVGYVGSHGYHELIGVDANEPTARHLSRRSLPGRLSHLGSEQTHHRHQLAEHWVSDRFAFSRSACPRRKLLHSRRRRRAESGNRQYLDVVFGGHSTYHALQVDLTPALQPRSFGARRLYIIENAGRWRFVESNNGGECAGPGLQSLQSGRG